MNDVNMEFIGPVDRENAEKLIRNIREEVPDTCERIHLAIQSPGGSVPVALTLTNILKSLKCEIKTYNIANVDSAAIMLFSAGTERVCFDNATFDVHPVEKMVEGKHTAESLTQILNEIELDTDKITKCLSKNITNTDASFWKKLMSKKRTLSAEEAIDIGLVHKIENYDAFKYSNTINRKAKNVRIT